MAIRRYGSDIIPFATPGRTRDVYYPNLDCDYRAYPYDRRRRRIYPVVDDDDDREYTARDIIDLLRDPDLDRHGDLGWSLGYATAWCYKHLVGSRTEVADAIDRVREIPVVERKIPFIIFDYLDRILFGGKLKGMVYLRWKSQVSGSPGTTSAPGIAKDIDRICIDLNKTPFEECNADIDDLLDALIHQMIHAYFLVTCGAQPKGATQDGRLMDGLHFGVILFTIRDITQQCQDGVLSLVFYAATRMRDSSIQCNRDLSMLSARNRNSDTYIAIDPRASAVGVAAADGQSHCCHDNRGVRQAQIKNWQVEQYSRAIGLDMEAKSNVIYDFGTDFRLVRRDRLRGPPSAHYVELVWNGKRVMVPRRKALSFPSLKKPIEKEGKMELKIPECSISVLRAIYDFMVHGRYLKDLESAEIESNMSSGVGPPVLLGLGRTSPELVCSLLNQIKVFKTAEKIRFEELQRYVLRYLYELPTTCDDPIAALRELYNEDDKDKPIHSELHRWARAFMKRSDSPSCARRDDGWQDSGYGTTNYEKLLRWFPDRFKELYHHNMALKDDCRIVVAELMTSSGVTPSMAELDYLQGPMLSRSIPAPLPVMQHPRLRRMKSMPDPWTFGWIPPSSSLSSLEPLTHCRRTLDELDIDLPSLQVPDYADHSVSRSPLALPSSEESYTYYARDGRLKWKARVGDKLFRPAPSVTYGRDFYSI